ncbi:hypothetical protein Esti_003768 [Eimeria stiedai]
MTEKEEIAADLLKGDAEGAPSVAAADGVLGEVAESDSDAQNRAHTSKPHLPPAKSPRPSSLTHTLVNLAVAAEAAYTEPSHTQQTQNDTGSVEQQRAMELLRSVDEEGQARGQVIVCSANDGDDDESLPPTPTTVALARPPSAGINAGQATEFRSLSSLGETETGMQAARPHATSTADGGGVERDGATEAGEEKMLATDDAYMAQLTMRALDREREEMLKELEPYPELEFLRREYEKLHHQLRIAQKNEMELKAKCLEMSAVMATKATQVHAALQEAGSEEETIKRLKRDLSACLTEVANEKAREAAETKAANKLRKQIEELYRRIEEEDGRAMQQTARLNELLQERDKLQSLTDRLNSTNEALSTENIEVMKKIKDLESKLSRGKASTQRLQDLYATQEQLQDRRAAAEEEAKKRERVERQLKQNKAHVEQQQQELSKKQAEVAHTSGYFVVWLQIAALQEQLANTQQQIQQQVQHAQEVQKRIQQTELRLNDQIYKNSRLKAANEWGLLICILPFNRILLERVGKMHELLRKKLQTLEGEKRTLDEQATALKLETAASEKEMEALRQQAENDKRQIESLLRERDLLSKNLLNADATAKKHADLAKRQLTHCEHLEKEVDGFRRECQQLQQKVETLEAERDRYGHTLNKSNQKYLQIVEQLKNEELKVAELERSIGEQHSKLSAQRTLYEAVRSDRNLFSRNLIASLDEMTELKHKFKLMFQQVGQLKEEIKAKDAGLLKQHFEHRKITTENENLKDDLGKAEKKLNSLEQIINAQKQACRREIKKLEETMHEAATEKANQGKEFAAILAERDMLGTQLLKRTQELSLLHEKVRIHESTLAKGEAQYKERLKEIKEWSRQCLAYRRELHRLEGGAAELEALKREMLQLQKELLRGATKVRALTEALATPMNVHRWRRLEGSDPAKLELVKKIQSLQKRLIAKTEEVIDRDLQIQEREKLFVQLKTTLDHQPGVEVFEQMQNLQADVRTRTKQLRAAVSELHVLHKEVTSKKDEIERLHKELEAVKNCYIEEKRREAREQQLKSQEQMQQQSVGLRLSYEMPTV